MLCEGGIGFFDITSEARRCQTSRSGHANAGLDDQTFH
jgi:hypothetical protein